MSADEVKIEVLGIAMESPSGGSGESDFSVVESRRPKEVELRAEEDAKAARVALKDGELDDSISSSSWEEESTAAQEKEDGDAAGMTGEKGESGAEPSAHAEGVLSEISAEEEEQEECGFCLFMKGGPCGERFSIWQNCVDGAEKSGEDIVEKCAQTTSLLKVCMEMNLDYYGPVLDAEKAMEEATFQGDQQTPDASGKSEEVSSEGVQSDQQAAADGARKNESSISDEVPSTGKVVEIVGVTTEDGQVTEVVDVVVEVSS